MEYKFRGKCKDSGKWVYGDLIRIPEDEGDYNTPPSQELDTFITNSHALGYPWIKVSEGTVGQFTGLCDRNGIQVYQGDIVKQPIEEYNGRVTEVVGYGIYEIKFKDDIYMNVGEGEGEWLCLEEFRGCEVIGSIYDNPELLNAK